MLSTSSFFNTKLSSGPQIWLAELWFESNWLMNILDSTVLFLHSYYRTVSPVASLMLWKNFCFNLALKSDLLMFAYMHKQWRFSEWSAQSAISLEVYPSATRPSLHWLCDEAEASKKEDTPLLIAVEDLWQRMWSSLRLLSEQIEQFPKEQSVILFQMTHRECSSCKDTLLDSDGHSESVACLGSAHAEATLTVSSCSHCENMSLACLHSQIALFHECSPPCPALPFSFSPKREKQQSSGSHLPGSGVLTSAKRLRTLLSPQCLVSPVCFTQKEQRPSSAASGLISFGMAKDEIAVDEVWFWGVDVFRRGAWSPLSPSPSGRVWPRSWYGFWQGLWRNSAWNGWPWKNPPRHPRWVVLSSAILSPAASSFYASNPRQAHQDMASPLLSVCKAFHCSCSPHLLMPLKRRDTPSSQAGSSLYTMSVLQVFQAKLLQDMDKSGQDSNTFNELRKAMYLALRATKAITLAISKAIANQITI